MKDLQNVFGDHLKALRKGQGLTQEKLAEKCGLSVQYLGDVERGKANPTLAIVEKIGLALDIPIGELFNIEDFQSSVDELRKVLQDYIAKADDKSLRQLYGILRAITLE